MKVLENIQKPHEILPGKKINLYFSLSYLTLLIIIPLTILVLSVYQIPYEKIYNIITSKRVLNAFYISFSLSTVAAAIDLILGLIIAWTLTKYEFPGRKIFDSIVDLPFAMPTAISGIALATLYAENGWIGGFLLKLGIKVSYTSIGILIALIFVGIPFVVRAIQPAIEALDTEMEEAATSIGAGRWIIIRKIIFPQLCPSIITGFTMSLARGLGEYGSVIFIAGNVPYFTEILPLLIVIELEQFDFQAATILAVAMLIASFMLLIALGLVGKWMKYRYE